MFKQKRNSTDFMATVFWPDLLLWDAQLLSSTFSQAKVSFKIKFSNILKNLVLCVKDKQ